MSALPSYVLLQAVFQVLGLEEQFGHIHQMFQTALAPFLHLLTPPAEAPRHTLPPDVRLDRTAGTWARAPSSVDPRTTHSVILRTLIHADMVPMAVATPTHDALRADHEEVLYTKPTQA